MYMKLIGTVLGAFLFSDFSQKNATDFPSTYNEHIMLLLSLLLLLTLFHFGIKKP